jgi:sugar phosphate isomerase/epimerase
MKLGAIFPNPLADDLACMSALAGHGVSAVAARPEAFVDAAFSLNVGADAIAAAFSGGTRLCAVWASKPVMEAGDAAAGAKHIGSCIDLADALREFAGQEALPIVVADCGSGDRRADWPKLVGAVKALAKQAEERQVVLAVRADRSTMVDRSRSLVALLGDVGSSYVQAALDAAATVGDKDTLDAAVEKLRNNIVIACARDVKFDQSGAASYLPAGQGLLNYAQYADLLRSCPGCGFLVATEINSEADAKIALAKLKGFIG